MWKARGVDTPEILLDKIASMSCKAAVKGNNELDFRQAEELMRELSSLDNHIIVGMADRR